MPRKHALLMRPPKPAEQLRSGGEETNRRSLDAFRFGVEYLWL